MIDAAGVRQQCSPRWGATPEGLAETAELLPRPQRMLSQFWPNYRGVPWAKTELRAAPPLPRGWPEASHSRDCIVVAGRAEGYP